MSLVPGADGDRPPPVHLTEATRTSLSAGLTPADKGPNRRGASKA